MKTHEQELVLPNESNEPTYSARSSGDGYEILSPDGVVIAWTLDRLWALKILLSLESVRTAEVPGQTNSENNREQ